MQINNPSGGAAVWGGITGTLTDQTDLDTALDAKRDILTQANRVYVTGPASEQTSYGYSASASANSIALRSASGTLAVATPSADTHATTKLYVDGRLSANQRTAISALTAASTAADIVAALNAA